MEVLVRKMWILTDAGVESSDFGEKNLGCQVHFPTVYGDGGETTVFGTKSKQLDQSNWMF